MDENINQMPQETPALAPSGFPLKKILSLLIGLIVFIGLIAVFIVFVLPRFTSKSNQNVTLTYWDIWEDTAPLTAIASEFTRQNPRIKIVIEKQDIKTLGKYIDRLSTRMQNKTGPDIFRFHNSWMTELTGAKPLLLPLPQEVVKAVELDSKFYPVVAGDLRKSGAYYGVPIHFDTLALFYNTQLFRDNGVSSPPSTWEDFYPDALKLTVKDAASNKITTAGAALGTYDNIAHASDIISLLMIQNGADVKNISGTAKESSDALDFYTSFAKGDSKVWDDTLDNSKLAFAKGNLAMYVGYSWDIFEIKAINPNLAFAVVPVPHEQDRNNTIASYWAEGVSAKSAHPKEAFEFLKFLASKENMEKLYSAEAATRLFGELYPRSDMADLLKDNTLAYPFVQQGKDAKSTIFSSDTYDSGMVDALNVYLGNAIRSILNDGSSPQSAVDTLSQGVAQKLSQYAPTRK